MKLKSFVKAILAIILLVMLVTNIGSLFIEYQWFQSVDFQNLFTTILFSKIFLFFICGVVSFVFLWVNFYATKKISPYSWVRSPLDQLKSEQIDTQKVVNYIFLFIILFISGVIANAGQEHWQTILKFFNAQKFNITDPIFNKNVAFYLFNLPFYNFIKNLLYSLIVLSFFASVGYYIIKGGIIVDQEREFSLLKEQKIHLSILGGLFFLVKAFGYKLATYELLQSTQGIVYGASYTDIHGQLIAYNILAVLAVLFAVFLVVYSFLDTERNWILIGIGGFVGASILLLGVYPAIIQKIVVSPNELAKERPYLKHNIKFTRMGFDVNDVKESDYKAAHDLSEESIKRNPGTIDNIRVWDWRPLRTSYRQLQEIRLYYDFANVDIGRYKINGKYTQVMLSQREFNYNNVPQRAKQWLNRRIKYTHGYGPCLSPVNDLTQEGLPKFWIKNIPPEYKNNTKDELFLKRPEIYFGELTNHYIFVNATTDEFDYPMGDDNKYTQYKADAGIKLDSFWERLLFSIKFGSLKLLISSYVKTGKTRLLWRRNIEQRVKRITPFIQLDSDPYSVIANNKTYWIIDGYTLSNRFPYSELHSGINYIRNSVKIVIDAYTGEVTYYLVDPDDPLIQTYQNIFPDLFTSIDKMPDELKKHLRYPRDLFKLQGRVFSTYHMRNPEVFYNKEDMWNFAKEIYHGSEQVMEPYYIIMKIPGKEKPEFLLMTPFTPVSKNNMISWLGARCDGESYGELVLFKFPKNKLVYGPMQIEARIDQNTRISEQLTLWSQKGSRIIRGNLLVIPVDNSIIYVEPLFLQAEKSDLPELKRVIVAYGDKISMTKTVSEGLKNVIKGQQKIILDSATVVEGKVTTQQKKERKPGKQVTLSDSAMKVYNDALERLKSDNWTEFGKNMDELKKIIKELKEQRSE